MKPKGRTVHFRINYFQIGICFFFSCTLLGIYYQSEVLSLSLRQEKEPPLDEARFLMETESPTQPSFERDAIPAPAVIKSPPAFLVIGIPTVPRGQLKPEDHFLHRTLQSLDQQLQKPMLLEIKVVVYNVELVESHLVFDSLREKYADRPYFEFLKREDEDNDPLGKRDHGTANKPGWKVRKQSRDLVSMMRAVWDKGNHFMFMEDDWETCNQGLSTIMYAVQKVYLRDPSWIMIRFSSGMNAIVLKDKDVLPFAAYLEKRHTERPPDHIVVEWYAGEKPESSKYRGLRQHFTFRYLLFHHIGGQSSLNSGKVQHKHDIIAGHDDCWRTIDYMFDVDRYYAEKCPFDDIYPCKDFEDDSSLIFLNRDPSAPSKKYDRKNS